MHGALYKSSSGVEVWIHIKENIKNAHKTKKCSDELDS